LRWPKYKHNPLNLVECNHIGRTVVELGRARGFVRSHRLGVLQRLAGIEVGGKSCSTEGIATALALEARVGRSTLLETLALQDIAHGRGMMLIGAHGDVAERVAREDGRGAP
jgi:hypothetical protein